MSERDKRAYAALKSNPERYSRYLEKKRVARLRRQTDRKYETERKRKWRAENRDKDRAMHKAHYAVEKALKDGTLSRPGACGKCGTPGPVEAHHHLGYSEEHWLHIVWLCQCCHSKEHRQDTVSMKIRATVKG